MSIVLGSWWNCSDWSTWVCETLNSIRYGLSLSCLFSIPGRKAWQTATIQGGAIHIVTVYAAGGINFHSSNFLPGLPHPCTAEHQGRQPAAYVEHVYQQDTWNYTTFLVLNGGGNRLKKILQLPVLQRGVKGPLPTVEYRHKGVQASYRDEQKMSTGGEIQTHGFSSRNALLSPFLKSLPAYCRTPINKEVWSKCEWTVKQKLSLFKQEKTKDWIWENPIWEMWEMPPRHKEQHF